MILNRVWNHMETQAKLALDELVREINKSLDQLGDQILEAKEKRALLPPEVAERLLDACASLSEAIDDDAFRSWVARSNDDRALDLVNQARKKLRSADFEMEKREHEEQIAKKRKSEDRKTYFAALFSAAMSLILVFTLIPDFWDRLGTSFELMLAFISGSP